MKKLSIEEKAQRYDNAIEIAKSLYDYNQPISASNVIINNIFPELKESEDERIRKEIIAFLTYYHTGQGNSVKYNDGWIAWLEKQGEPVEINPTEFDTRLQALIGKFDSLPKEELIGSLSFWMNVVQNDGTYKSDEKQGKQKPAEVRTTGYLHVEDIEQKPTDKAEPKFKVGDWVVSPNGVYWHIDKISNNRYEVTSSTGESSDWNLDTNIYHRFTIQDAKDGDVLVCENGWTCIFNCLNNNLFSSHCFMDDEGWFCEDGGQVHTLDNRICGEIHPATKEQYDQLEKAMVNAGYKWNKKERKLEKIEQKHTPKHKVGDTVYYDSFGRLVSFVIANIVEDGTDNPMYEDKEGNAIFEKDLIEQNPAWSEEDEYYYGIVQYILNNECVGKADRENAITWYNFLKDRVHLQSKQEWSEEDDILLNDTIYTIKEGERFENELKHENCHDSHTYQVIISWLKSLKERVQPQQEWKPSDEQIKAIKWIIDRDNPENWSITLKNLYQDLKKLKG